MITDGPSLELTEDQVEITYKTYISDDPDDMQAIIDQKLAPVGAVLQGHQGQDQVAHAMVLDTYDPDRDVLVFKNTYDEPASGQPKKIEIERTDRNAPEELYFVHIEVPDTNNLPSQADRQANKTAEVARMIRMWRGMNGEADTSDSSSDVDSDSSEHLSL